ncbi:hypothetical protein V1511DRAFT_471100 [Dipodascopsis uninucleata]
METIPPKHLAKAVVVDAFAVADILISNIFVHLVQSFTIGYPQWKYTLTAMVAASVWGYLQFIIETVNKFQISFSGDILEPNSSAILVCNHRSYADYILLHALSNIYGMQGRLRFLAWRSVFFIPSLRWLFKSFWVSQDWTFDCQADKEALFQDIFIEPIWLVTFPETIKYSLELNQEHQRYCRANGLPRFLHLLYPRFEAFVPTMKHVQKETDIKLVYDVTFIYRRTHDLRFSISKKLAMPPPTATSTPTRKVSDAEDQVQGDKDEGPLTKNLSRIALSLRDILFGSHNTWELHVHVRRLSVLQLPTHRRGLEKWLEKTWVRKDKLLDGIERKGMSYKGIGYVYFAGDDIFAEDFD